jgi:hypothetical protein
VNSFALNIYDLLYHEKLVLSRSAAKELEQLLGSSGNNEAPVEETAEAVEPAEEAAPAKPKRVRKPKKEAA